jgi:Uma2 family endonuclease
VLQPDLIVLLNDRIRLFGPDIVENAPSLAVEIISPSSTSYDRITKRNVYALYGVPEYWLVDPEKQAVTIPSDPRDGRYRAEQVMSDVAVSATIPGLSADLKALFAPVPGL